MDCGEITSRRAQKGLTLVELLVVIVILALASSVVMLNAPPSRPPVQEEAERFAALVGRAQDEMILAGVPARLVIDALGYGFEHRVAGEWTADAGDKAFGRRSFAQGVTASVSVNDLAMANAKELSGGALVETEAREREDDKRRIDLDPLGAPTAFDVRFVSRDAAYVVTMDEGGAVLVKREK